jgi:predicted metalloprotease with PDZ domain
MLITESSITPPSFANKPIKYSVHFDKLHQHLFSITVEIPKHSSSTLILSLPAWIPGSYMIRDFSKHIIQLNAQQNDLSLPITLIDKQHWSISTQGKACQIHYQVYAFDSSVRTAYLDQNRAFFNGSSLFLLIDAFEKKPHEVHLIPSPQTTSWKVATGLQRSNETALYAFGCYMGANYAELIDSPFEIGAFTPLEFKVSDTPHYLILNGHHYADTQRLIKDVTLLCQHHIDLFERDTGGNPPFNAYWFLINILPTGFGGLEHKNSTALLTSTFDFPNINEPNHLSDGYKGLLGLISHEYFHSWNVCRIKPDAFIPYSLNNESYTQQLWAYEGITSYYDDFSLYRTGIISFNDYLKIKSQTISRVNRGKGQSKQNLIESSFFTWTKFYQQGADASNNIISYYTKGALLALWLDLTLRKNSDLRYSLDDVMRQLWNEYLSQGEGYKGTHCDSILSIVHQFISIDISDEFHSLLYSTSPIPLFDLLKTFGIALNAMPSSSTSLLTFNTKTHTPYLGFMFKGIDFGLKITQIVEDSPCEQSGLSVGDHLIAIDGWAISEKNAALIIDNLLFHHDYSLVYIRNGRLFQTTITPSAPIHELTQLRLIDHQRVKRWKTII